ncbi:MAG: hypothetical protein GXO75_08220 [Calditrichaeota bacterium]|nr:hypothetical protein [Calditrichota bacterium]
MAGPALPLIAGGMTALNFIKPFLMEFGMLNPELYRDYIMYSGSDLAKIREGAMSGVRENLNMLNLKNVSAIQQAGAARRMPSGAILSGIAGSTYQVGRGAIEAVPKIEARLAQMKKEGERRFFDYLNRYKMGEAAFRNAQIDELFGTTGSLGKIALLWQAGLLG